ncbi:hypothetical protein CPTSV76_162 [Enterobacteria phage SV76]|nr:hypothetical protein CPTSV76_162 [Enterobacteria phage SV76]
MAEQLLFFLILQLTLKFLQITSKRNFRVILMMIYVFVYLLILCAVIGNKGSKFRGLSLSRILYIIDEPVKSPDMDKIYSVHIDTVHCCCNIKCCIGGITRPQFFVIGMQ